MAKNGPRRPGTRKIIGVANEEWRGLDCQRLHRQAFQGVARLEADRALLMAAAKLGNVGALILLKEQWGVRLPKVEGQVKYSLPWMRKSA